MATFKKAGQGIVAQSFICANTVKVGDNVSVTADNTVGHSTTSPVIGEVVAVEVGGLRCTVELYSSKIETSVAEGAGIVAGSLVKQGSVRGKVALANMSLDTDTYLAFGVALAAAADATTVTFVTFR